MIVEKIYYSKKFSKRLKKLPKNIIDLAFKKEEMFRENSLHPSLRLHELHGNLKGLWSISINNDYRIIIEKMENGNVMFHSIGGHSVYKK